MQKNTIPNTPDGLHYCILSCKFAKYCGPRDFDYECTCEQECNNFNQFDIPEYRKHEERYIRDDEKRKFMKRLKAVLDATILSDVEKDFIIEQVEINKN